MDGCLSTIVVFSATFYCKNIFYGQYFRIWKQILKMVSWYNTASHSKTMTEHFESTPLLLCFLLNFFQPPQKSFIHLYKCLWKKVHARTDRSLLRLFNWESWPESNKQQDTEAGAVKDIIQSSAQYLLEKSVAWQFKVSKLHECLCSLGSFQQNWKKFYHSDTRKSTGLQLISLLKILFQVRLDVLDVK